ncbi:hypothetical protein Q8F55_009294 [Vanrija albida]|uniref:F-box domain-containing protein n=1 Tax=Vanrija albida TaxID=181172 RepID=A0ABR3PT82_9TREE
MVGRTGRSGMAPGLNGTGRTSELAFELFEAPSRGLIRHDRVGPSSAASSSSSSRSSRSSRKQTKPLAAVKKLTAQLGPERVALLARMDVHYRAHNGHHMRLTVPIGDRQQRLHDVAHVVRALNDCRVHAIQLRQWIAIDGGMAAVTHSLAQLLDTLHVPTLRRLSLPVDRGKTGIFKPPLAPLARYLLSPRSIGLTHLRMHIPRPAVNDPEVIIIIRAAERHPTLVHMCFGWCVTGRPAGGQSGGPAYNGGDDVMCDLSSLRHCPGVAATVSQRICDKAHNEERVKAAVANTLVPARVILRGLYAPPRHAEAAAPAESYYAHAAAAASAIRKKAGTNLATRIRTMFLPASAARSASPARPPRRAHGTHKRSPSHSSISSLSSSASEADSPPPSKGLDAEPVPRPGASSPMAKLPVELVFLILQYTSGDMHALTPPQWRRLFEQAQEPAALVSLARASKKAVVGPATSAEPSEMVWVPGRDAGFKAIDPTAPPPPSVTNAVSMTAIMDEWMDAEGFHWEQ